MAQLYNLEPQPTAKVILQTTAGDISVELFGKQTPLSTRNFLQHCVDGTYTNTIFHRLIPDFIIQGGDPTGTGSGGISAINEGEPFQDEFHSRLKFNRRGLLGMANEGKDSNGSQFFFTLAGSAEVQGLTGKNTMFGRVEGDTIYNLMKMADVELVEGEDRPLYPSRITGVEVLVNPFEDMVARVKVAPRVRDEEGRKEVKKRKKPAGKNVLSFGGEEGDEETAAPVLKKVKANPKLVSAGVEEPEKLNNTALPEAPQEDKKARRRKTPSPDPDSEVEETPQKTFAYVDKDGEESSSSSPEPERIPKSRTKLEQTNAEIAALKASMKRNITTAPAQIEKPRNALEAMIPSRSTRGRKRGKATDEKGAFDLFKAFKQRLDEIPGPSTKESPQVSNGTHHPEPPATTTETAENEDEADLCDLHFIANCQSCASWDDDNKPDPEAEADGEDDGKWMAHQLTFAKDTLGKDLEWKRKMEEIEVIDPREKARSIKEEAKRKRGKEKGKGKE